jgi:hypothetical protein
MPGVRAIYIQDLFILYKEVLVNKVANPKAAILGHGKAPVARSDNGHTAGKTSRRFVPVDDGIYVNIDTLTWCRRRSNPNYINNLRGSFWFPEARCDANARRAELGANEAIKMSLVVGNLQMTNLEVTNVSIRTNKIHLEMQHLKSNLY